MCFNIYVSKKVLYKMPDTSIIRSSLNKYDWWDGSQLQSTLGNDFITRQHGHILVHLPGMAPHYLTFYLFTAFQAEMHTRSLITVLHQLNSHDTSNDYCRQLHKYIC